MTPCPVGEADAESLSHHHPAVDVADYSAATGSCLKIGEMITTADHSKE